MTKKEYERIQEALTRHLEAKMDRGNIRNAYCRMNRKEREVYRQAILAAKSVVSNSVVIERGAK